MVKGLSSLYKILGLIANIPKKTNSIIELYRLKKQFSDINTLKGKLYLIYL